MNDSLNIVKSQAEELIQSIFTCLQENQASKDNCRVEEKIDLLIQNTEKIIQQNAEIISLNKEILNYGINIADKFTETPFEQNKTPYKFDHLPSVDNQPLTDDVKQPEIKVEKTPENSGTITHINKVAEEPKNAEPEKTVSQPQEIKTENQFNKQPEEVQIKQEETDIQDIEETSNTSSVLEFLHKRVIKDTSREFNEETIGSTVTSTAREITQQIKKDNILNPNRPKSIAEQFENKTNMDLMSAIGVSEKFMFINDLFLGNLREYTGFVNDLNAADSLTDSLTMLDKMQKQKKWAKGSLAYTTLEGIITKRFE